MIARASNQCGFSLLEVVVAFAIAAISLGVLGQIFGQGSRNLALSRDYADAIAIADALLAEYGRLQEATPFVVAESTGPFQWQVAVQAYTDPQAASDRSVSGDDGASVVKDDLQMKRIDVAVEYERYGPQAASGRSGGDGDGAAESTDDLQMMSINVVVGWERYGRSRSVSASSLRVAERGDNASQ